MKRAGFIICLTFQIVSLFPQEQKAQPAVGICATDSLRIRSFHNLEDSSVLGSFAQGDELLVAGVLEEKVTIDGKSAPWYLVVSREGIIGWSFGGYIELGSAKPPVEGSDPDSEAQVEQLDLLSSEGALCSVVNFGSSACPRSTAIFTKLPGGKAQVLYLRPDYTDWQGYARVEGLRAVDFFGDGTKEICLELSQGDGDFVENKLILFGRSSRDTRYAEYGVLPVSESSGGGGWDMGSSTTLIEGPTAFLERSRRYLRLVTMSVGVSPSEGRGDGGSYRTISRTKRERVYEFTGSKFVLRTDTVLEEESLEEKRGD